MQQNWWSNSSVYGRDPPQISCLGIGNELATDECRLLPSYDCVASYKKKNVKRERATATTSMPVCVDCRSHPEKKYNSAFPVLAGPVPGYVPVSAHCSLPGNEQCIDHDTWLNTQVGKYATCELWWLQDTLLHALDYGRAAVCPVRCFAAILHLLVSCTMRTEMAQHQNYNLPWCTRNHWCSNALFVQQMLDHAMTPKSEGCMVSHVFYYVASSKQLPGKVQQVDVDLQGNTTEQQIMPAQTPHTVTLLATRHIEERFALEGIQPNARTIVTTGKTNKGRQQGRPMRIGKEGCLCDSKTKAAALVQHGRLIPFPVKTLDTGLKV
eukprot:1157464-Pelagomonas_calceolata.AAC.2